MSINQYIASLPPAEQKRWEFIVQPLRDAVAVAGWTKGTMDDAARLLGCKDFEVFYTLRQRDWLLEGLDMIWKRSQSIKKDKATGQNLMF